MTDTKFKILLFDEMVGWTPNWLGDNPGEDFDLTFLSAHKRARIYSAEHGNRAFGVAFRDQDEPNCIYAAGIQYIRRSHGPSLHRRNRLRWKVPPATRP